MVAQLPGRRRARVHAGQGLRDQHRRPISLATEERDVARLAAQHVAEGLDRQGPIEVREGLVVSLGFRTTAAGAHGVAQTLTGLAREPVVGAVARRAS